MDFNTLLQQGAAHAWLYLPVAVLLGALHGLEPGHSKTMMAAFIIAVRGTVVQAALLGLSAAISHSLIIWALAALALRFGNQWNVETAEPYFLMGTGAIVIGMAVWTLWRVRRNSGHHDHHHHDEKKSLVSPDGALDLSVFEDGMPPRFRIAAARFQLHPFWSAPSDQTAKCRPSASFTGQVFGSPMKRFPSRMNFDWKRCLRVRLEKAP